MSGRWITALHAGAASRWEWNVRDMKSSFPGYHIRSMANRNDASKCSRVIDIEERPLGIMRVMLKYHCAGDLCFLVTPLLDIGLQKPRSSDDHPG